MEGCVFYWVSVVAAVVVVAVAAVVVAVDSGLVVGRRGDDRPFQELM